MNTTVYQDELKNRAYHLRPGAPRLRVGVTPRVKTAVPGVPGLIRPGKEHVVEIYEDELPALQGRVEDRMDLFDQAHKIYERNRRAYTEDKTRSKLEGDNPSAWSEVQREYYGVKGHIKAYSYGGGKSCSDKERTPEAIFRHQLSPLTTPDGSLRDLRPLLAVRVIEKLPPFDEREMAARMKAEASHASTLATELAKALGGVANSGVSADVLRRLEALEAENTRLRRELGDEPRSKNKPPRE